MANCKSEFTVKFAFKVDRKPAWKELGLIAGIVALATIIMWSSTIGLWTEQVSYDTLAIWLRKPPPKDMIIVYMNEQSHVVLKQPYDRPWDRAIHAQLVDYLRKDGAKMIYFDILFEQPSLDAKADAEFARAIKEHGNVILGASIAGTQEIESTQQSVIAPYRDFRAAAKAWGSLTFFPVGSDYAIRQIPVEIELIAPASLKAATLLRNGIAPTRGSGDWMRYFGPPNTFSAVSYHQVLQPEGRSAGFFKDKIVIVGAKYTAGLSNSAKDGFSTPYLRFGRYTSLMPGTEVHANLIATLRDDLALRRIKALPELLVQIVTAAGLVWVVLGLRPAWAGGVAFALTVCSAVAAWLLALTAGWWGNWFLFAGIVVPSVGFVSVSRNYYVERVKRQLVTRVFSKYASPEMVRQVVESGMDVKPGGTTKKITAMMTDIKGFSTVAQKMAASELSGMLVAYFTELTSHIFRYRGTVLQYAGDGSYSVWGALLEDAEAADQAVRAAVAIRQAMRDGKLSETRAGISTGMGLCGNLGAEKRLDYTVIGDNVNLASRLEGANKKLGTHILVADSTRQELKSPWVLREVGDFLVAGRDQPVRLWEPIVEGTEISLTWRTTLEWFAKGLDAWRAKNAELAAEYFRKASHSFGAEGDGPSKFYLAKLERIANHPGEPIGGVISLTKD